MAVSEVGNWLGYLSGGCIESSVALEACRAIEENSSRRIRYGKGSPYIDIRLPCGGGIELFLDVSPPLGRIRAIVSNLKQRQAGVLKIQDERGGVGPIASDKVYFRTYFPRTRLVIVGIGPVALQLTKLAQVSGFDSILLSPDHKTLNAARTFSAERHHVGSNVNTLPVDIDNHTAVVVAFHDHDREQIIWPAVLESGAFYVGAMGSRKTHQTRVEQLKRADIPASSVNKIRSPAGLSVGSRGATDIAISILAEITQVAGEIDVLKKNVSSASHISN